MDHQESTESHEKSKTTNLNIKFGRLFYFTAFLILSFTWNITAVVEGGQLVDDNADLKESQHETFLTLMMIFGIFAALPQIAKRTEKFEFFFLRMKSKLENPEGILIQARKS